MPRKRRAKRAAASPPSMPTASKQRRRNVSLDNLSQPGSNIAGSARSSDGGFAAASSPSKAEQQEPGSEQSAHSPSPPEPIIAQEPQLTDSFSVSSESHAAAALDVPGLSGDIDILGLLADCTISTNTNITQLADDVADTADCMLGTWSVATAAIGEQELLEQFWEVYGSVKAFAVALRRAADLRGEE